MSLTRRWSLPAVFFGVAIGLLAPAGAMPVGAAENGPARLETFTPPNGDGYFALSLVPAVSARPTAAHADAVGHDVLVLFDTSASQVNAFRDKALEALDFLLASLGPNDRVQLSAVDLNFIPLTNTFVAPQGDEMKLALEQLRARTPLGSTDMTAVLRAADEAFAAEPSAGRVRAVAYLGDGMSTANLIATGDMQKLVDALVAKRAAVSSFAVGPRVDLQVLGVLANHTGGLLIVDQDDPNGGAINGKQAGSRLTQAVVGTVAWPVKGNFPATFKEMFPTKLPPLRFDRDAIVLGVGAPTGKVEFSISAEIEGRPIELTWSTDAVATADDHAYLPELIAKIRGDGGIALPTVGSAGLGALRSLAFAEAYQLLALGKQAASLGSYDEAERLIDEALRIDPNNGETQAAKQAVAKARAAGKGRGPQALHMVNFQPAENVPAAGAAVAADPAAPATAPAPGIEPVPAVTNDEDAAAGLLLQGTSKERKIITEMVMTEVQNGVNEARGVMARSPDSARSTLKALVDKVQGRPELDAIVRSQLLEQIQTALRTVERQAKVDEERRIQREAVIARQQEQDRLYRDLIVGQQKTEQLMARFENLMDERRYRDAQNVAEKAAAESTSVAPTAAAYEVRLKDAYEKRMAVQQLKWQGFSDAIYQGDRSTIPFADDPPIVYPSKEVWEMLSERRKKWDRVDVSTTNEAELRIREVLDERTEMSYDQTALADVVTDIKLRHKINIDLDNEALAADGKGSDTPITRTLKDISLRSALRLILEGQGLTYLIKNEVMLITTKTAASAPENLETRVYPVGDLVIPIPKGGLSGFGGLGGGMAGGMGGGGGGMGGGGMGGGGGGMGGMGGGGGGFFAVEDELRLSGNQAAPGAVKPAAPAVQAPAQPAAAAQVEAPAAANTAASAEPIRLKLEPNADVERVWDDHFAVHEESPTAVRATVRTLMKEQQPRQAAAVIMAALKHHQAQPWMYEALGLAMEMQGARVAEIERALMSAADFSAQPEDLMRVAEYMVKSNLAGGHLQKRALELYREVSKQQPTRPEPYVLGLRIAQHLDDVEGIKWATLGILSQAWTSDQRAIYDEANRVANGVLEKLRVEKRTAEAEAFQTALKTALVRDCVIQVSWSGDADVDLIIEEPAGTTCSFRTPRTTSGGVLVGDMFDKVTNLHTEAYVCPQGFDGDYRILAKRVWGKLTADTLTVDIIAHAGAPNERRQRKQVPLQDDQAVMAFDMHNGRRQEPLKDVQVANAIQGQMALGRQVLAQQLSLANDPRVAAGGRFDPRMNPGFFLRGAVGYQPVIITLPTGANMSMIAVVSHDRRFVRVSPQPFFSSIPSVNTFNYSAGSSGTSNGANNGPGFGS